MILTRLSCWFITACHGGREAGSNVFTCCDILGPFFGIFDKSVWRWVSLTLVSLLLYNMHMSCSNLQQTGPWSSSVSLRCEKASRWSAGKASPLLSGWGLSYNHSQCTHWRLQELDKPKIEMGTTIVINNLWSIVNNTTANKDIPLTRGPIFFAGWLICMHLELFLPPALSFMTTSQRWWAWWRNTRKISASSTWIRTWDVFCDALAVRFTNTFQVLVCGDDANVFILLFHHAHRLCDVIMELDVSGRNNCRCINISEVARKICPQVSEISLLGCTMVQNRPKVVDIYSSPHFYSRYVKCWLLSTRTLHGYNYTIAFSQNRENGPFQLMMSEAGHLNTFTRLRNLLEPPYHHGRLWWTKLKRVNLMAHVWKYAHLDNMTCWKPVEHEWNVSHCNQMPQEVLCDDGSPNDDNDTGDECMTPSEDESG